MIATVRPRAGEHAPMPAPGCQQKTAWVILKEPAAKIATCPTAYPGDANGTSGAKRPPEDGHEALSEAMVDGELSLD